MPDTDSKRGGEGSSSTPAEVQKNSQKIIPENPQPFQPPIRQKTPQMRNQPQKTPLQKSVVNQNNFQNKNPVQNLPKQKAEQKPSAMQTEEDEQDEKKEPLEIPGQKQQMPVQQLPVQSAQVAEQQQETTGSKTKKPKWRKWAIAGAIVVIIAGLAYYFLFG